MTTLPLHELAQAAGIATEWTDAFGELRRVDNDVLRTFLTALDLPASSDASCRQGLEDLRAQTGRGGLPPMLTTWTGQATALSSATLQPGTPYQVQMENGELRQGRLGADPGGQAQIAAIAQPGYHRFEAAGLETTLAVAPRRCFSLADALRRDGRPDAQRCWGLAAQLYSLRRDNDGGLGDFTALESLARAAAGQGACALAISPVHAMFSADPARFSPYGPSSRLFFNVLHIDPSRALGPVALQEALQDQLGLPGSRANLSHLEAAERVDWPAAAAHRLAVLRRLFMRFRQGGADTTAFSAFCSRAGQPLQDHARFEAMDAWLRREQPELPQGDWRRWPAGWRDPRSTEVEAFAQSHAEEIAFHQFLQWQADAGREAAQTQAREAGMSLGIIADLAVGADPGGSQAWSGQSAMLNGFGVGAPPDLLARQGQNWGLGAFSPRALQAQGFAPWLDMLRANMRHSGGIRIDHVLGLKRLWLVPDGAPPSAGAYLHFPLQDLLRLTALESLRHSAIVIGEDLGTVPQGFSEQLADTGVLGIRVLWFQREKERFLPPQAWSASAMATTSTHDLATAAGWWKGQDIIWRERLGLLGEDPPAQHQAARETDKSALWSALQQAGCTATDALPVQAPLEEMLAFVGSTPAALVMLPLEDALGMVEQPNLPGTVAIHPNWQQRLPMDAAALLETPDVRRRLSALGEARATVSALAVQKPAGAGA
jgi:4-alpha-glucanotransferase